MKVYESDHDCVWDRIRRGVLPEPIGAPFCSVCWDREEDPEDEED